MAHHEAAARVVVEQQVLVLRVVPPPAPRPPPLVHRHVCEDAARLHDGARDPLRAVDAAAASGLARAVRPVRRRRRRIRQPPLDERRRRLRRRERRLPPRVGGERARLPRRRLVAAAAFGAGGPPAPAREEVAARLGRRRLVAEAAARRAAALGRRHPVAHKGVLAGFGGRRRHGAATLRIEVDEVDDGGHVASSCAARGASSARARIDTNAPRFHSEAWQFGARPREPRVELHTSHRRLLHPCFGRASLFRL